MNKEDHAGDIAFIDEVNDRIWNQRGISMVGYDPMALAKDAYERCIRIGYRYGEARCKVNQGMGAFIVLHDTVTSLQSLNEAMEIFRELDDPKWIANTLLTIGIIQNSMGNPEAALYNALKGIDYYEHNPEDKTERVMAYYVVGTVYKDLRRFEESERNYKIGLSAIQHESDNWAGRIYASLSNIYAEQGNLDEALKHGLNALRILKAEKNDIGVSRALTDIGIIYKKLGNYESALACFFEGLEIREKANIKQFIVTSLVEIASVYKESGEIEKAIGFYERAEKLAVEINLLPRITRICEELVSIYKEKEDYKRALYYSEKNFQMNNELNKKEAEKKIDNLKNSLLREKEEEIERIKNVELKAAYHLVSEKQKEILDSINYAHRIQKALSTPEIYIEKSLARLKKLQPRPEK